MLAGSQKSQSETYPIHAPLFPSGHGVSSQCPVKCVGMEEQHGVMRCSIVVVYAVVAMWCMLLILAILCGEFTKDL